MASIVLLKRGKNNGTAVYVSKHLLRRWKPKLNKLSRRFFLDLVQEHSPLQNCKWSMCGVSILIARKQRQEQNSWLGYADNWTPVLMTYVGVLTLWEAVSFPYKLCFVWRKQSSGMWHRVAVSLTSLTDASRADFLILSLLPWRWRRYVPPKRWLTPLLHGATSQKTAFFIVTAVKTSTLTNL
jgi:hypothetical protein